MDYPHPPGLLSFPSSTDKPDELLAELHEAQIALAIAEHHIRLWRTNSVTGNRPFRQHHSCVAHEALYESGKTIDRVAEMLKIQVNSTQPACQPSANAHDHADRLGRSHDERQRDYDEEVCDRATDSRQRSW